MWYYKNYDVICTSILKWFMNLAVLAMNDSLLEKYECWFRNKAEPRLNITCNAIIQVLWLLNSLVPM